jgi:hypothetical protein
MTVNPDEAWNFTHVQGVWPPNAPTFIYNHRGLLYPSFTGDQYQKEANF